MCSRTRHTGTLPPSLLPGHRTDSMTLRLARHLRSARCRSATRRRLLDTIRMIRHMTLRITQFTLPLKMSQTLLAIRCTTGADTAVILSMSVVRAPLHMPRAARPETRPPTLASHRVTTLPLLRIAVELLPVSLQGIILALLPVAKDDTVGTTAQALPHMACPPLRRRSRTALIQDWREMLLTVFMMNACTNQATAARTRRQFITVSAASRRPRLPPRLGGIPHSHRIAVEEV